MQEEVRPTDQNDPLHSYQNPLWRQAKAARISRRTFLALAAAGRAAAVLAAYGQGARGTPTSERAPGPSNIPVVRVPLSPVDAKVVPTAWDYYVVGCGYLVYTWPVGDDGGPKVSEDALGAGFPVPVLRGNWISTNMHTIVDIDGRPNNVVVIPDSSTKVVNIGGDHSVRGGTLSQKLYHHDSATRDRLQKPLFRVDGGFVPIPWDAALDPIVNLSTHVLGPFGELAWAMEMYSYNYYGNTCALTKFALGAINTRSWASHDKPAAGADTPGLSDAGINAFSAAYEDWRTSEVMLVSGVSLYETKSILFQDWVAAGGATLIVINPRRDFTAAFAESRGGLHLQLIPGTDTVLNNSIARVILENGWGDFKFIRDRTVTVDELAGETFWRRKMCGMTFEQYSEFILADETYIPENASAITGVPADQIRRAAEIMSAPDTAGVRPKTSVMLGKGNYWEYNYENMASLTSIGLLAGAGGWSGQMISRAGGHQRGMTSGAPYLKDKSPDSYEGNTIELNLDRRAVEGNVGMLWGIRTTWLAAMDGNQSLARRVRELIFETGPQLGLRDAFPDRDPLQPLDTEAERVLTTRTNAGGMVLVQSDIYSNALTEFTDLVPPASPWGEENHSRMQGERRLRIYSKIMDSPGETRPDWWRVAQVAKRMGFEGFDWQDSNAVFEEASQRPQGTVHDYIALIEQARSQGKRGHDRLRELGTTGIQCPITVQDGELVGTVRLNTERFSTSSGNAIFVRGNWNNIKGFQTELARIGDQLWVTNMRVNEHWQSQFDDVRIPICWKRFPVNILEMNPRDAAGRNIMNDDVVEVPNDAVLTQTGGTTNAKFEAVAYLTDEVRLGETRSYFNFGQGALATAANNVSPGLADPINNRYRYKLGKRRVVKIGMPEFQDTMSFLSRNLV